jgi:cytochrome c biogenesis protein CcmG/thiol:disulfide interchange protein DsbE
MKGLRLILWVPLIGLVFFLVFFRIGLNQPEQKTIPSALIGQQMPDFTLAPAMAGRPGLSSAELRQGRPRLINIFASWCIPCRQEAPQLEELARRGIPIDGIAVRDRPEDLSRFLASYGDPFRSIGADVDRRVQLNLGSAGVPETFIIDGRGIIRHQHIGPINAADMPAIVAAFEEASR